MYVYLLLFHSLAYAAGATERHRWTSEVREVAGRAPVTGTAWTALALAPARSTAARHKNNKKHSCSCDAAVVMLLSLEEHCHKMGPLDGLTCGQVVLGEGGGEARDGLTGLFLLRLQRSYKNQTTASICLYSVAATANK